LTEKVSIDESIWTRQDLKGLKIGIPKEYFIDGIDPGVRAAIDGAIAKIRDM
jgi:aspartyl-tRNA(Asn)/glutamyl-tRNA(Gln) amidotransferase subunit A